MRFTVGLDLVELVMAVEEEFKIAISNTDAEKRVTVGKLVDYVHSRLRQGAGEPCPSQHGFYIVRRNMMNLLRLKRSQILPEVYLEDLIGRANRRKVWRNLLRSLTDKTNSWPPLVRPKWMNFLVILLIPVAACICVVTSTSLPMGLAIPVAAILAIFGGRFTTPEFPSKFLQVQDLIKLVKTLDSRAWSKDEVFEKIRKITVDILGVKESQVTLDASFVGDLGAG